MDISWMQTKAQDCVYLIDTVNGNSLSCVHRFHATPSLTGAIIGVASIVALVYLYRNADMFSNGNVGDNDDGG